MEETRYSETSFLTRLTRRHIPEDDILLSHRCENLKSYKSENIYTHVHAADLGSLVLSKLKT
jgi:hypothetical protein